MSVAKAAPASTTTPSGKLSDHIDILPKLLWFIFAVVVFFLLYKPVLRSLDSGNIAKVSFAALQIEFAKKEFGKASALAPKEGQQPPREFAYFQDRIQRNSDKINGTKVLWVDDKNPVQNFAERRALTALGISFDLAVSTDEAQQLFDRADEMSSPYDLVISDMGREPRRDPVMAQCYPMAGSPSEAGCKTLATVSGRYPDQQIPVIFYTSDGDRNGTPPGAFGATNRFDELVALVLDAAERRSPDILQKSEPSDAKDAPKAIQ